MGVKFEGNIEALMSAPAGVFLPPHSELPPFAPQQKIARWVSSEEVMRAISEVADMRSDDASLATLFLIAERINAIARTNG